MKKKSSLRDTVCLIVEFLRHHLIKIFQFLIFQNLCMQSCHTIDREPRSDGKMCHFYLAIINDCHFLNFIKITGIFLSNLVLKTTIDFFCDLINSRKQAGE